MRMVVKQWTRASRVSVSVQVDTLENTAKQVGSVALKSHELQIYTKHARTRCTFNRFDIILFNLCSRHRRVRVGTLR